MGAAIVHSFKSELESFELAIMDRGSSPDFQDERIKSYQNKQEVQGFAANVVIFAVKPQMISGVIAEFKEIINRDAIIISILAGTKISTFQDAFPDNQIVRVMPNLGAKIAKSVNLAFAQGLEAKAKDNMTKLLNSFGYTVWLKNEAQLHEGTAVAGSGTAYYFLFIKLYAAYLEKAGFEKGEAKNIAAEVAIGAADIVKQEDNLDELIKNVTSKGGTTEAALNTFYADNSLSDLIEKSLGAATQRSKDLG